MPSAPETERMATSIDCSCPICRQKLFRPCSLGCGHNFCQMCLGFHLMANAEPTCPVCRQAVATAEPSGKETQWIPNRLLEELISDGGGGGKLGGGDAGQVCTKATHQSLLSLMMELMLAATKPSEDAMISPVIFTSFEVAQFIIGWMRGENQIASSTTFSAVPAPLSQMLDRWGFNPEATIGSIVRVLRLILTTELNYFKSAFLVLLDIELLTESESFPTSQPSTPRRGRSRSPAPRRVGGDGAGGATAVASQEREAPMAGFPLLRTSSVVSVISVQQALREFLSLSYDYQISSHNSGRRFYRSRGELYLEFFLGLMGCCEPQLLALLRQGLLQLDGDRQPLLSRFSIYENAAFWHLSNSSDPNPQ